MPAYTIGCLSAPANIRVGHSAGRGRGVFSVSRLEKGQLIEACPVIVVPAAQERLIEKTVLYDYYFAWRDDCALALGYGSLYNHSNEPNTRVERDFVGSTLNFVALRDIEAGEELTHRYSPVWFEEVDD